MYLDLVLHIPYSNSSSWRNKWITARLFLYTHVSCLGLWFTTSCNCRCLYSSTCTWPHCMWRCNRICTWTEKVNCIFALDALASWAAGWDHHCHECYAVATNLSLILQCWRHDKLHIRWNWIRYLISINKWTAVYGFTLLCITHIVISRSAYVLKCVINTIMSTLAVR